MGFRDLRGFLDELERRRRLRRIAAEVDRAGEIACIARWVRETFPEHEQFALRFDRVRGFDAPVAVGLYSTHEMYALALEARPQELLARWAGAVESPLPPRPVGAGPAREVIERGDDVDLDAFPVPVWTPGRDAGPYISSASVITKDPQTGIQNMGVYRVQVQGRARMGLFFGTDRQHGAIHLARHERRGEPMPVAVVVGGPPAVHFAAAAKTAYGVDELHIAGALAGFPIDVVRCETVELLVPARAEYVIEGLVHPQRGPEGPFGEALGYMNPAGQAPVVEVSAVTRRLRPIMHGYVQQMPPSEGHVVWELGVLGPLYYYLTRRLGLDAITDLAIVPGAAGVSVLAVQLALGRASEAARVADAICAVHFGQRIVVLVDEDVELRDPQTLLWAASSRADPARDVRIVAGGKTWQADPSVLAAAGEGVSHLPPPPYQSSMMIVDATLRSRTPQISLPPRAQMEQALERWPRYGLPPLPPRPRLLRLLAHHADPGDEFALPAAGDRRG
jgi:UbiD family decarboxylase